LNDKNRPRLSQWHFHVQVRAVIESHLLAQLVNAKDTRCPCPLEHAYITRMSLQAIAFEHYPIIRFSVSESAIFQRYLSKWGRRTRLQAQA